MEHGTAKLSAKDVASMQAYWAIYAPIYQQLNEELTGQLKGDPVWEPVLSAMTPEQQAEQNERSFELQRAAIEEGAWEPYLVDLRQQGTAYAQMGIPFGAWFEILALYRESVTPRVIAKTSSPEALAFALQGLNRMLDVAMAVIGEGYLSAKQKIITEQQEKLIRVQREALIEMSTPVIEVWDKVLVLPIIGTLDSQRTQLLTENLLRGISEKGAEFVILDVSGVPTIDTLVSQNLMKTMQAARLMGATSILCGLRPETAQSIVHLGIDIGSLKSRRTLREALALAMKLSAASAAAALADGEGAP